MLSDEKFESLINNAPLFSVDLVLLNPRNHILVGYRINAPAKCWWFVPGGRVYKNESLDKAFNRISIEELGLKLERERAELLGIYDHFYSDSVFGADVSSHYINAAHVIKVDEDQLKLPTEQHSQYRWVAIDALAHDEQVHKYSKVFLPVLTDWLKKAEIAQKKK